MTVAAVVLAAGGGSRFRGSTHKLRAEIDGVPIVRRAVDAAVAAGLDETIVVVGAVELGDVLPAGVTVLRNDRWAEGQAGSLAVAVEHAAAAGHAAVVAGLGDQPFVPSSAWRAVAEADHAPIVAAVYEGRRRNPVRLAAEVWPLLPRHGDEGARPLMARRPDLVGTVTCQGDPVDIDRLEDLDAWS